MVSGESFGFGGLSERPILSTLSIRSNVVWTQLELTRACFSSDFFDDSETVVDVAVLALTLATLNFSLFSAAILTFVP